MTDAPVRLYAVWYYDVIVRGPFAQRPLATAALKDVTRTSSCVYEQLKVGPWDESKNAQIKGWTHPSVLLMTYRSNHDKKV